MPTITSLDDAHVSYLDPDTGLTLDYVADATAAGGPSWVAFGPTGERLGPVALARCFPRRRIDPPPDGVDPYADEAFDVVPVGDGLTAAEFVVQLEAGPLVPVGVEL